MTLGIIGAGKLGITVAQLARRTGFEVMVSGSRDAGKIQLIVETLAPGALAATNQEIAERAEVIILALPLGKFRQLDPDMFSGKLVIDAMNYWWEVDGPREDILPDEQSSSEAVQDYFSTARVVKTLSHMGYHDLHDEATQSGEEGRKALAIAGDNAQDVQRAGQIINKLGFDPVPIGGLQEGRRLEPGSPVFGASVSVEELRSLLVK